MVPCRYVLPWYKDEGHLCAYFVITLNPFMSALPSDLGTLIRLYLLTLLPQDSRFQLWIQGKHRHPYHTVEFSSSELVKLNVYHVNVMNNSTHDFRAQNALWCIFKSILILITILRYTVENMFTVIFGCYLLNFLEYL